MFLPLGFWPSFKRTLPSPTTRVSHSRVVRLGQRLRSWARFPSGKRCLVYRVVDKKRNTLVYIAIRPQTRAGEAKRWFDGSVNAQGGHHLVAHTKFAVLRDGREVGVNHSGRG